MLRDGQQLLLFQNHLSGLQGSKLAAMLGTECTGEQSRTPGVPADICPGQPGTERQHQRLSRRGESRGMAPVGTRRVGQRKGAPPFPEAGEDPTVLAPGQAPSIFPSQGTKATLGTGQGPEAWTSSKERPSPTGDVNLGLTRSPAPPGFPPLSLAPGEPALPLVVGV